MNNMVRKYIRKSLKIYSYEDLSAAVNDVMEHGENLTVTSKKILYSRFNMVGALFQHCSFIKIVH